jgi:BMFP domain-containing protein YqiC
VETLREEYDEVSRLLAEAEEKNGVLAVEIDRLEHEQKELRQTNDVYE